MLFTIVVVLTLAYFVLAPVVTIWSLNTLFNFDIDYNLKNFAAALWIISVLGSFTIIEVGSVTTG